MAFFVLCSNLYCVFHVYGCLIKVEFHLLKCFILCGLMFFCFTLYYLISLKSMFKTRTDTVVIYPALCVVNSMVRWVE